MNFLFSNFENITFQIFSNRKKNQIQAISIKRYINIIDVDDDG